MKIQLIAFLLVVSISASSQIRIEKKPVTLVQLKGGEWNAELAMDSSSGVKLYYFLFRNNRYRELVDVKLLPLASTADLKQFGEAFKTALKIKTDDRVTTKDYFITKAKAFGFTGYTLFYNDASCELSSKMVQKLIDAIDKL